MPEFSSEKQSGYESHNNNTMDKTADSTPLLDFTAPPPPPPPPPPPAPQHGDDGSDIIFQC